VDRPGLTIKIILFTYGTCHEIIHVLLVERDDLDLGERVESLVQLPPVKQVEEGGQVQQQEQGRRSVPSAVHSCTMINAHVLSNVPDPSVNITARSRTAILCNF
jgi:hypothetical protein